MNSTKRLKVEASTFGPFAANKLANFFSKNFASAISYLPFTPKIPKRLRCTSKIEIAAGVTPEIRIA